MFDFKNIFTITRKELKSAFDNPTAYVIIAVFLLLWEFLFLETLSWPARRHCASFTTFYHGF